MTIIAWIPLLVTIIAAIVVLVPHRFERARQLALCAFAAALLVTLFALEAQTVHIGVLHHH